MGIAGIGVIGRCTLKILGPFEVSYIPPEGRRFSFEVFFSSSFLIVFS